MISCAGSGRNLENLCVLDRHAHQFPVHDCDNIQGVVDDLGDIATEHLPTTSIVRPIRSPPNRMVPRKTVLLFAESRTACTFRTDHPNAKNSHFVEIIDRAYTRTLGILIENCLGSAHAAITGISQD